MFIDPVVPGSVLERKRGPPQAATARHTGAGAAAAQSPPTSSTASSWEARAYPDCPVGQCGKRPCDKRV